MPGRPFSLPGILGYDTGDLPFPERGDSVTGDKFACDILLGGCSSCSSSDETLVFVIPLSPDAARGLVKLRPKECLAEAVADAFRGFPPISENKGLGTTLSRPSFSVASGSVTTLMDCWAGLGGIGADDERR